MYVQWNLYAKDILKREVSSSQKLITTLSLWAGKFVLFIEGLYILCPLLEVPLYDILLGSAL